MISWKIETYTPDLPRNTTHSIIKNTFQIWSNHADIDFKELTNGTADINIVFTRRKHPQYGGCKFVLDGEGGVIGHAFYPLNQTGRHNFLDAPFCVCWPLLPT